MATEIKLRRGTKAQHDDGSGFTGAEGEVTVDTTDDTLRVHDGSLKGGHVIAKLSDVEASDTLAELLAKGNSTGSNDIQVDGTDKVTFGAESGGKLEIYEDDSQNGVIKQTGTGALKISGIYGTLNNDSDEELISWDTDNAGLSWRGASGAGLKLFTKETGIGVTGTVNASDGLTADYIDLTGGESTTTTGTIACKQIVLNDPTSTNDGDDGTDLARIYTESTITNRSSLVIHSADDGNDQIVLRTDNDVDVLVADSHGINVTGTVDCDGLKMDDGEYAQFGTANDLQIFHSGNHSYIKDRGTGILSIQSDGDSITFHDSANARDMAKFSVGGTASLNWAGGTGTGTKLATTATGINVTGTVTASDGLTADYIDLTGGESTTTTGTVACTTIKLADPSTPENDQHLIYTEADSVDSPLTNLVIHAGDDTHEKVILRVGNNNGGHIDALKATGSGVDIASSLDVTGTVTADGVNLADDKKLTMGTSDDFRIYKNASGNAIIHESGSGNLEIRGESGTLRNNANETCLGWNADKAYLYWQGDTGTKGERLKTTDSGIDVTGTVTCDEALTISSTGAAADAKPDIWLFNNAPAAVNERLGQITWYGKNDVSPEQETVNYAFQEVKTTNVGDSTEQAEMQFHIRNGASHVEVLTLDSSGIDVTGTVEADAFSGTGTTAITDFVTAVSTNNNDTTVPTTAAVKSYVDNNDGDTTYTGGTGLTLNGTTFNVDAAQTGITSVGTLSGLTTGATTVNGSLSVNSTSADTTYSPEIVLERNGGAAAGDDGDKLGVITFKGDDTSGTQAVYAQIGARIVDDGADNTNTKGEIRIACGYNATANLEDPSLRIDHLGTWINESQADGSADSSFYNVSGFRSGIKYWANQSSGYAIEVKSATPTADRDIKFPDVSGLVVVSGVAGGSMNGGGGLGTAQTAWSPEQFMANANTDYYHYTDASTDVDLLVAVPFSGIDLAEYGTKYTFRNISANANSKITIDLDGFTSASSQGNTQYYSINKYDGSTPSLITSAAANLVISVGGVIEMSPISSAVWHVTGTGFA